jgi:hypothetical protein
VAESDDGRYPVADVTEWKREIVDRVKRARDKAGKDPVLTQSELAPVPSPFEAQSELAQVPVDGGGNGDGGNRKAFECLVEVPINHGWVEAEF